MTTVNLTTCCVPDCPNPRMVGPKSGKTLSRCEAHQRSYDRDAKSNKRQSTPKPEKLAKSRSQAKEKPAPKPRRSKKAGPVKVMLLDYEGDVVRLLTVKSEQRVPMAGLRRGEPHPHTVGLYMHLGYQAAEIRTAAQQTQIVTLQQRIDAARAFLRESGLPMAEQIIGLLIGERTLQQVRAEGHQPYQLPSDVWVNS